MPCVAPLPTLAVTSRFLVPISGANQVMGTVTVAMHAPVLASGVQVAQAAAVPGRCAGVAHTLAVVASVSTLP